MTLLHNYNMDVWQMEEWIKIWEWTIMEFIVIVGRAVTSCAVISTAFVYTFSSKQIYPVSVQTDFLAGEVSNHLDLSPDSLSMFLFLSLLRVLRLLQLACSKVTQTPALSLKDRGVFIIYKLQCR